MAVCLSNRLLVSSGLIAVLLATYVGSTIAEGFRIETKVFKGEEKEKQQPVSETTTLFLNGAVYDFLKKPEQTAVYRKSTGGKPGQFTLLSDKHSIQTKFTTKEVDGFVSKLRTWAAGKNDAFLKFAANPEFDESFESANGKLVLASRLETYTVTTEAVDHPDDLSEYKEFLDSYARLNAVLSGGQAQPGPRLRLNAALAKHKVIPLRVELTRDGEDPMRAEHEFTWRLSQDDLRRIDNVRTSLSSYRDVKNQDFLRMAQPAKPAR
jgi:hypothetical protein